MSGAPQPDRLGVIGAVRTPIAFLTLVVLVVESVLGAVVLTTSGPERLTIVYIFSGLLILAIAVVCAIAYLRPEALRGKNSVVDETVTFAVRVSTEVYFVLNMYLSNLDPKVREEAYETLSENVETSRVFDSKTMKEASKQFAGNVRDKAAIGKRSNATLGPIKP